MPFHSPEPLHDLLRIVVKELGGCIHQVALPLFSHLMYMPSIAAILFGWVISIASHY